MVCYGSRIVHLNVGHTCNICFRCYWQEPPLEQPLLPVHIRQAGGGGGGDRRGVVIVPDHRHRSKHSVIPAASSF